MIRDLNFEITKTDKNGDPIEAKLIAIGDAQDLKKAFSELSKLVIHDNGDKK